MAYLNIDLKNYFGALDLTVKRMILVAFSQCTPLCSKIHIKGISNEVYRLFTYMNYYNP